MGIVCVANFIEIVKYYMLMRYFLNIKERNMIASNIMAVVNVLIFSIYSEFINKSMFWMFTIFIIIELLLLFKDNIIKLTLISVWMIFFVSMLDVTFSMFFKLIIHMAIDEIYFDKYIMTCVSGILTIIFLGILIYMIDKKTERYKFEFGLKYYVYMSIMSVVEGATVAVFQGLFNNWGGGVLTYLLGIIMCVMLILNICMVVFLAISKDGYRQMNEMNEDYIKMQEKQYSYIKQVNEDVRKFKHDSAKHMKNLKVCIENKNYDEASEYIERIVEETHIKDISISVGNSMIDALLNQYAYEAQKRGVKFSVKGELEYECILKPYDICVVFSNMLENAIEAAKVSEGKYIKLTLKDEVEYLEIMLINSFYGKLNKKNGKYITTKNVDVDNHGYGIRNVKSSVNKYKGICNIYDEDNMFVVYIKIDKK